MGFETPEAAEAWAEQAELAADRKREDRLLAGVDSRYEAVERNGETIWVHKTKPVWIVHYDAVEGRVEFWQPYRAIAKVKRGAAVWSADNKRVGDERQFRSLEAAMLAGDALGD